jgi:hypothetical protein
MEMSGQLNARVLLYYGAKSPRYPLERRFGGPQRRCNSCGEQRSVLPLPGIEPDSSVVSPALYSLHGHEHQSRQPSCVGVEGSRRHRICGHGKGRDRSISYDLNLSGQKTGRYVAVITKGRRTRGHQHSVATFSVCDLFTRFIP